MSLTLNGHPVDNGSKIKFGTINTYDPLLWVGVVIGIVDYSVAKLIGDIDNYHNEVLKDHPNTTPLVDQKFLILNTTDGSGPARKVVFGVSHINETTLQLVDVNQNINLRLFNIPTSSIATAIQLLAENGFQAKLITE
jgi:hypothetical protein